MMRLPRMAAALAGAAAILTGCNDMKQIKHMPYPRTERTDVTDNYFGTEVPDPYRWLEDDNSEATAAWVKAQNVVTQDYLSQIPFRGAIRERLTELWNYPKEGIPAKHGDAWYYFYNDGLRNQSVLYRTAQPGFDADYAPVECRDGQLYYVTNRDASNYALMKVDLNDPSKVSTVIPESGGKLLEGVGSAGGYLFATYLEHAQSKVCQYGFDGKLVREIELPAIGTVSGFDGEKDDTELYYSLTNYIAPATIYKYDIAGGASTLYKAPAVNFDPSLFTTEQVFYTSKDGTKVPMFITRRKDMKLDGGNPCYLYAYGGFQINQTPAFRPSAMMFVEQGGIYCVANLRGGSEYGEAWHKAGMLENKQNVFDDFIAAAEYLIAEKYTSSDKLAIAGGSNGGLLVGACEVQRPDLYAVCLPAVGVMDMLRYHKFTIGWG